MKNEQREMLPEYMEQNVYTNRQENTKPKLNKPKKTKYRQGTFVPEHPEKYKGDVNNITYRSSWELHAFRFLDANPHIKLWASEELAIAYLKPSPIPNHPPTLNRYFPDLYVEYMDVNGKIIKELIEVKPKKQLKASTAKKTKTKLTENYTLAVNMAKWQFAEQWCKNNGVRFSLLTEDKLFGHK